MKRKLTVISLLAATLIFIIAYTTIDTGSHPHTAVTANVKKEKSLSAKSKVQKKKPKKKPQPLAAKRQPFVKEENKSEEINHLSPQHIAARNLVAKKAFEYSAKNQLSTDYCFLVDMSLPSGRDRFFIYDLKNNSILYTALVAHGSCNETFLARPRFSNATKSGCSSLGKYQIGQFYTGKYGKSYRLTGLDRTNSNAYNRAVVIHGYDCVPDKEIYPRVLCNSLGCIMVSYKSFDRISGFIKRSQKPVLLWVYQG